MTVKHRIFFLLIEDLICFVKKLVGNLMLFDNLDYNFSLLQHMFKKAKELSDEKVFSLITSQFIMAPPNWPSLTSHFENIVKRMLQVNIAVATYEMIDKHIRKLDSDLAKFESEMKVVFNLLPFVFSPLCPGQRPAVADGERGGGGGEQEEDEGQEEEGSERGGEQQEEEESKEGETNSDRPKSSMFTG